MNETETTLADLDIDTLIALVGKGDEEAAVKAIARIESAKWMLHSRDRQALDCRIVAGPKLMDTLRETTERAVRELDSIFRHHKWVQHHYRAFRKAANGL